MIAILSLFGCLTAYGPPALAITFGEPAITAVIFIETKESGDRVTHHGFQAKIVVGADVDERELQEHARQLFKSKLEEITKVDPDSDFTFITFFLGPTIINGQPATKTFRSIFVKRGGEWQELSKDESGRL